jgi:hypothetical protein
MFIMLLRPLQSFLESIIYAVALPEYISASILALGVSGYPETVVLDVLAAW